MSRGLFKIFVQNGINAEATVVPNPSLSGSCVWSKNPTKAANGATPSGVSLANSYGRCNVSDGALATTAYKSNSPAVASWPTNGIVAAGTYASVSTNVTCTPAIASQTNCPSLTVNDGADYVIECNNGMDNEKCGGSKQVTLKLDECVEISVLGWTNSYDLPETSMVCTVNGSGTVSFTINVNGTTITASGSYYAATNTFSMGKIKVGDNELGTICLTAVNNASSVSCGFN